MAAERTRIHILDMIEKGEISPEEGLRLLQELGGEAVAPGPAAAEEPLPLASIGPGPGPFKDRQTDPGPRPGRPAPERGEILADDPTGRAQQRRAWWTAPLWVGAGFTVLGGIFMYAALRAAGLGFWFMCASLPLWFGLTVIALAWWLRTAPWFHLRFVSPPGAVRRADVDLSLPLPIGLTIWLLRVFRPWILRPVGGRLKGSSRRGASMYGTPITGVDLEKLLSNLNTSATRSHPISIEGEDGSRLEIFMG